MDRRFGLSKADFAAQYEEPNRPVVLTGGCGPTSRRQLFFIFPALFLSFLGTPHRCFPAPTKPHRARRVTHMHTHTHAQHNATQRTHAHTHIHILRHLSRCHASSAPVLSLRFDQLRTSFLDVPRRVFCPKPPHTRRVACKLYVSSHMEPYVHVKPVHGSAMHDSSRSRHARLLRLQFGCNSMARPIRFNPIQQAWWSNGRRSRSGRWSIWCRPARGSPSRPGQSSSPWSSTDSA